MLRYVCGGACGPCREIDVLRRKEKLREAGDDEEERRRAARFETRGVRRCKQWECATFLNRDYNAAVNIGCRLRDALNAPDSYTTLYVRPEDVAIDRLQSLVNSE